VTTRSTAVIEKADRTPPFV